MTSLSLLYTAAVDILKNVNKWYQWHVCNDMR